MSDFVDVVEVEVATVEVVEVLVPGPKGDKGDDGASGSGNITGTAAQNLSGHRAVTAVDGRYDYADNTTGNAYAPILLTTGAIAEDDTGDMLVVGVIEEPSWAWTADEPIWLGANGALTQTAPTADDAAFLIQLGVALTATSMFFQPRPPIALGA